MSGNLADYSSITARDDEELRAAYRVQCAVVVAGFAYDAGDFRRLAGALGLSPADVGAARARLAAGRPAMAGAR